MASKSMGPASKEPASGVRLKPGHDTQRPAPVPPDSDDFFAIKDYLEELEELGDHKTLLPAIEEHLRSLYFKERSVDAFFETIRLHQRLFMSLHRPGNYKEVLARLLKKHKVPGVFARLIDEPDKVSWNAEAFRLKALDAEKQGEFQDALDYCDLMLRVGGKNSQAYLIKGRVLEDMEEYDAAGDAYKRAVELDDSNYKAYHRLAIRFMEKSPEIAMSYIDRALSLHPASGSITATKARVYRQMREYQKAIDIFDEAIRLSSENAYYIYEKGQMLEKTAQTMAAIGHFRRAAQLDGKLAGAFYALARLLAEKQPESAITYADTAAKLCPNDVEMLYMRALLLQRLGETDKAIEQYNQIVQIDPKHHQAYFSLGSLQLPTNPAGAAESFGKAASLAPENARYQMNLARALMACGKTAGAARAFERVTELDPTDDRAWYSLGLIYAAQQPSKALDCFSTACRLNPAKALYVFEKGKLLDSWKKDKEGALACFDLAAQMDPNSAEFHLRLAQSLDEAGKEASAVENYKSAIRLGGDDPVACASLARLLYRTDTSAALGYIDGALRLNSKCSEYYFLKANILFFFAVKHGAISDRKVVEDDHTPMVLDEGDTTRLAAEANPQDILYYLDRAIRYAPKNSDYYRARGTIFATMGRNRRALEQFRKALGLDSGNHQAYFGMAQLVSRRYRDRALPLYDKAIALAPHVAEYPARKAEALLCEPAYPRQAMDCIDAALAIMPANGNLLLAKARLLEKLENPEEALEFYRRTVLVNDKCAEAYARMGYLMAEQPENALEHLHRAIDLEPRNTEYYLWAARMFQMLEDIEGVQRQYAMILELRGDTDETRYLMACLLVDIFPGTALIYIDQALEHQPENVEYLLQKGAVLAALGRDEEAVALYRDIASEQYRDTRVQVALAKLLFARGDSRCITEMDRAVSTEPHNAGHLALRGQMVMELLEDLPRALADIAAAVKLRPQSLELRLQYIELLEKKGSRLRLPWQRLAASRLRANAGAIYKEKPSSLL